VAKICSNEFIIAQFIAIAEKADIFFNASRPDDLKLKQSSEN